MKLTTCTNCGSLEKLLSSIECTLVQLMREKLNSLKYNIDYCFDTYRYKALLRYKRIIKMRLRNPSYPASDIKLNQILTIVTLLVDDKECSKCVECDITTLKPKVSTPTTTIAPTTTLAPVTTTVVI